MAKFLPSPAGPGGETMSSASRFCWASDASSLFRSFISSRSLIFSSLYFSYFRLSLSCSCLAISCYKDSKYIRKVAFWDSGHYYKHFINIFIFIYSYRYINIFGQTAQWTALEQGRNSSIWTEILKYRHFSRKYQYHIISYHKIFNLLMLRLLSSKAQGPKDFWKPFKPCHVGIEWIALSIFRWVPMCQGFSHF